MGIDIHGIQMPQVTDVIRELHKRYDLNIKEASRIAFIISELQRGYTFTIYPRVMEGQPQICEIEYEPLEEVDKRYLVSVQNIDANYLMHKKKETIDTYIDLEQLVTVLKQACPGNAISLSMDFEWEGLEISVK